MLMERCEEHKQVRSQIAWLLMTPPVPDWLFSANNSVLDLLIIAFYLQQRQTGTLEKAAKSRNGILLKKNKRINYRLI